MFGCRYSDTVVNVDVCNRRRTCLKIVRSVRGLSQCVIVPCIAVTAWIMNIACGSTSIWYSFIPLADFSSRCYMSYASSCMQGCYILSAGLAGPTVACSAISHMTMCCVTQLSKHQNIMF